MKKKLWTILEDNTTKQGRYFDFFIQLIILLSLLSFSLETLPNLPSGLRDVLEIFELISIVLFSVEYILRVIVSKKPLSYIFSFYGIIDLLAVLPFFLNTILDLRFLRAFRVFRVFRALKLIRYNKALNRFKVAFKIVKEELVLFFIVTMILLFLTSAGIYLFENQAQPEVFKSVFHSGWWSIVTLTTVGYGDVYPITLGGKIFTFFVLMIGIGIVAVPAGLVGTALSKARELEEQ
jgi:voltage-gated potassium channel|tara:strand:- start:72 stop:779 length:708 start_codon:yes stop_codon:yes gene_type:complete